MKFKVGDRVTYIGTEFMSAKLGTIKEVNNLSPYPYKVVFDNSLVLSCYEGELELYK